MDNQNITDVAVNEGAVGEILSAEVNEETEDKDFKCEPCLFENTEVKATAFCIDCFEHVCYNCARDHRRNKILRNHKLLESEEIPKDLEAIKALKRMMTCSDHPDTDVRYKCEDHDKYICVTCLAEFHRKCSQVNEICKVAPSGTEDLCSVVEETLSQLQAYTVASKTVTEENIESLRSQHSAVQKEQENVFDSIYEQLAQRKQEIGLVTDALVKKELNDFERNLQRCKEAEKEKQVYQRLLDATLKFGNAMEVNVIPDLLSRKAKLLRETLDTKYRKERVFLKSDCSVDLQSLAHLGQVSIINTDQVKQPQTSGEHRLSSDEVLEPGNVSNEVTKFTTVNTSLQCSKTKYLDEIPKQLESASLSKEQGVQSTSITKQKSHPPSLMKHSVSHRFISYSVRCHDDTSPCCICAIVILPDDRLVVIDHHNMKLKVFKKDFSLAFTSGLRNKPFAMCHAYDMTVAVVLLERKAIWKYCIGQSHVSNAGKFPTKFHIDAVEKFGNDKKMVILFSDERNTSNERFFIQIRDAENGRILKTLYLEKSAGVILNLEDGAKRITCRGTNEIFVSECQKLYCFDIDRSKSNSDQESDCYYIPESWFYKSRKGSILKDISYLTGDEEGNIYVCSLHSNNIHQISAHNFNENRIIISNIKWPLSVSVNSKKCCLVVGCVKDDFIHVYHFC